MFKSFRSRLMAEVVGSILLCLIVGSLILVKVSLEYEKSVLFEQAETQQHGVMNVLNAIKVGKDKHLASSMALLKRELTALGPLSTGDSQPIGDTTAPELHAGSVLLTQATDLVDQVSAITQGVTTVFSWNGTDLVRVSTSVKKDNGDRAIGTTLANTGAAYAALTQAGHPEAFQGVIDILGKPYFTRYEPLLNAEGKLIGALFVGERADTADIEASVNKAKLLTTGFVAVADATGMPRFIPAGASLNTIKELIAKQDERWTFDSEIESSWGYQVIWAYPLDEMRQVAYGFSAMLFGGGLVATVFVCSLLLYRINKQVIQPLGGDPVLAQQLVKEVADGRLDLHTEIHSTPGSLVEAIVEMKARLRHMLTDILSQSEKIHQVASTMRTQASGVQSATHVQTEATNSIAATLEQITVSIQQISDTAKEVRLLAAKTEKECISGLQVTTDTLSAVNGANGAFLGFEVDLKGLIASMDSINQSATAISSISSQTNLLALNAAIEAARAGEDGRGFAVVADEVRKLAEKTKMLTETIQAGLSKVAEQTATSVTAVADGKLHITDSLVRMEESGQVMQTINSDAGDTLRAFSEIQNALEEQAAASELIAQNISQVSSMSGENMENVHAMADEAAQLDDLAQALKVTVSVFKL